MSEQENDKLRPTHRVSFARINGRDKDGNDTLGRAQEIGQIWPRRGKEGEGILRFDHIPEEMRAGRGGVLFIKALDRDHEPSRNDAAKGEPRDRSPGRSRNRDIDRDR